MNLIITLIAILLLSYLFNLLAKKIKMPNIVALILIGVILGSPIVKDVIIGANTKVVFVLGDIALLFLMFLAGLESSWSVLFTERKSASLITLFSAVFSFLLGVIVFLAIGFPMHLALIVGICVSITAEEAVAVVLMGLKRIKSKMGATIIGAGILDDVFGFSLFFLVTYFLKEIYLRQNILLFSATLSFFVGLIVREKIRRMHINLEMLEKAIIALIIPFFFVTMGINFDLGSVVFHPVLLMLIVSIAIIGKLGGTLLAKPFLNFKWKQLYFIGWAMNSRGAVSLALALIAFRGGLIPIEIYSSIVFMALLTTLMFPIMVVFMLEKDPNLIK